MPDHVTLAKEIECQELLIEDLRRRFDVSYAVHVQAKDLVDAPLNAAQIAHIFQRHLPSVRNKLAQNSHLTFKREMPSAPKAQTCIRYGDAKSLFPVKRQRNDGHEALARAMRALADNTSLSQREIAEALGVSLSTVSRVLRTHSKR